MHVHWLVFVEPSCKIRLVSYVQDVTDMCDCSAALFCMHVVGLISQLPNRLEGAPQESTWLGGANHQSIEP